MSDGGQHSKMLAHHEQQRAILGRPPRRVVRHRYKVDVYRQDFLLCSGVQQLTQTGGSLCSALPTPSPKEIMRLHLEASKNNLLRRLACAARTSLIFRETKDALRNEQTLPIVRYCYSVIFGLTDLQSRRAEFARKARRHLALHLSEKTTGGPHLRPSSSLLRRRDRRTMRVGVERILRFYRSLSPEGLL
jgi:hypothetical protein